MPARTHATPRMTRQEYLQCLEKLGLKQNAKATAEALGISLRTCQRCATDGAVPPTVAVLGFGVKFADQIGGKFGGVRHLIARVHTASQP